MIKKQFSIEINASKEKVWTTHWEDKTFRDWSNIIDQGTYMKGIMKEGNEVQFISSAGGFGVTRTFNIRFPGALERVKTLAEK